jgi:hypothetical protein
MKKSEKISIPISGCLYLKNHAFIVRNYVLSMILMFFNKFHKSKDKICPKYRGRVVKNCSGCPPEKLRGGDQCEGRHLLPFTIHRKTARKMGRG